MRLTNTYVAAEGERQGTAQLAYLFALFWTFVLLRFALSANLLDRFVSYSAEGGSVVEKIHPSTYGILLVLVAALFSTRIELTEWELRALRSLMLFAVVTGGLGLYTSLLGHSVSMGYLVDSYIVACASGALLLFFPRRWREWLGGTLLAFITAGACIAFAEFITRRRLLPYPIEELTFRPTGLSEHPLVLGLFNAVGIGFVAASRWNTVAKIGAIFILLLGTFASGARVATVVAALSTLAVIALQRWPGASPETRFRMKTLVFLAVALAVPVALVALIQFGLLERFQKDLFDTNAMARVNIYALFSLVSWNDILFGANAEDIKKLAALHLDLDFIESSIVMFIFAFGLFGTILFLAVMARTLFVLVSGASRFVVIGTCAFFFAASGNNSLATKTPIVLMIVLLIIAFHDMPATRSR
jgi:hypothetical protein